MIQNAGQSDNVDVASIARSLRQRRRKRTYSNYVSDDSAVEADLDSGSDSESTRGRPLGPSKAKRFRVDVVKSGGVYEVDPRADCCHGDAESFAREGQKLLMRQWLQIQADQGTIPGLVWIDEKKTQIRIPWKHGSRTGWTIDDCRVYRAWATHTGKIACISEPKKWKANFRCALNSLPDVRELPQLCQKKGSDPFKVYQMLPEVPRKSLNKKTKRCKTERTTDEETEDFHKHKFPVTTIKIKEEAPVSECKENMIFGHSFRLLDGNIHSIKKEEPDTDMQYSQSLLIPTVVEEFSEQGNNESSPVLTDLHSVCLPTSEMALQSNSSSTSSSCSSSFDSAFLSDSSGENYCDDFTDYNLFEDYKIEESLLSDFDIFADGIKAEFLMTSCFT